jgi:hypothetical protein
MVVSCSRALSIQENLRHRGVPASRAEKAAGSISKSEFAELAARLANLGKHGAPRKIHKPNISFMDHLSSSNGHSPRKMRSMEPPGSANFAAIPDQRPFKSRLHNDLASFETKPIGAPQDEAGCRRQQQI